MDERFVEHFTLVLKEVLEESLQRDAPPFPAPFCEVLLRSNPCSHSDCSERLTAECLDLDPELIRSSCQGGAVGVPAYPLYKKLASTLCEYLFDSSRTWTNSSIPEVTEDETQSIKMEDWLEHFKERGSSLLKAFNTVSYQLHVKDKYFAQLQDGSKTVEGRCATGSYARIQPGDTLLFNKLLYLQVKDVRCYKSFKEMLESEGLQNVLPGVSTVSEGVQVYRQFYTQETESIGVLAIHVCPAPTLKPSKCLTELLHGLQADGVMSLLGICFTKGTAKATLPPPRSLLIASFLARNPEAPASRLSVGGRALAKHVHRSTSGWWGDCTGTENAKNKVALQVLCRILDQTSWMNIHHLSQPTVVFEARVPEGYGARWSSDGTQFRGFLEPQMEDGHACKWRH